MKKFLILLFSCSALLAKDPKREFLARHLESVELTVLLNLPSSAQGGLRSMFFDTSPSRKIDPEDIWPDGTPSSGSAMITTDAMSRLLDVIDRDGFFARASAYYYTGKDHPTGPPPAKEDVSVYIAKTKNTPSAELELIFPDGDYYTYYFIPVSWADEVVPLLTHMREAAPGSPARSLLLDLLKTHRRFK